MEQLKDLKNLDIYYDDTIAAVQKGFENYADRSTDDHCVDDRPDETTHSVIIEKEDEDCNSASNAEQNDYNVPVRKVNEEMKGLENDTDDLAKELPFTVNEEMKGLENDTDDLAKELPFTVLVNDHDGEQFLENAGSIMDVQNKKEIDTLNEEIDDTDDLAKELPFTEPPDNHDNSQSKMAVKKKRRQSSKLCSPIILAAFIFIRFTGAQGSDPGQQDFCGIYQSELSEGSGPWNDSMCSSELKKIQCQQTGQIKHCVPFISRIQDLFAVCINFNLTDDQCILVTQTENGTYKVQCYEGKKDCSTHVSTSPPTSLKSTQDPLTVNITNPQPNSQPIESSRGMMTAARDFGVCCLIISFISFIIVLLFICHFVGYALCLAQFQRSCNELWSKLISNIRNQEN